MVVTGNEANPFKSIHVKKLLKYICSTPAKEMLAFQCRLEVDLSKIKRTKWYYLSTETVVVKVRECY